VRHYRYPTRADKLVKAFRYWLFDLTIATGDNGWFWFSMVTFFISLQLIFHPELVRDLIDFWWWFVNGGG
jgi:hypothetical protein